VSVAVMVVAMVVMSVSVVWLWRGGGLSQGRVVGLEAKPSRESDHKKKAIRHGYRYRPS
jgi:hypothetical protein